MNDMKLTQKTPVSLALAIIVGGVVISGTIAQLTMGFSLQNKVALVGKDVGYVFEKVEKIEGQLVKLTDESHSDIRALRKELSAVNVRLTKLETK